MSVAADGERSASPAVSRAAAVLDLLADRPSLAVGPSELARRTGVPKSTILNICSALLAAGLVRRNAGGYQLGGRLTELGTAYLKSVAEVEEFYELCRRRLPRTAHTVQLAVLGDGLNTVYLARHDGTQPLNLGLASEIGRSVPAHCTAAGKALLAALGQPDLLARLDGRTELPALTPRSISTSADLLAELDAVRRRGYSIEHGEIVQGLRCFGLAVRTPHRADGLAALSFSYPENIAPTDVDVIRQELHEVGSTFAEHVGGRVAWQSGERS